MKTPRLTRLVTLFLALVAWMGQSATAHAQVPYDPPTAFTYQGRLDDGGSPANGLYDFRCSILDSDNETALTLAGPLTNSAVLVNNGLFTLPLDFGSSVFDGNPRWLELGVTTNGGVSFTTLSPRQHLMSAPYAVHARTAATLPTGAITSVMLADGAVTANKIQPGAVSQLGTADGSSASAVQVMTNGSVGIGTVSPRAGLEISTGEQLIVPRLLSQIRDGTGSFTNISDATSVAASATLVAVGTRVHDAVTLLTPQGAWLSSIKDGVGVFTNLNWVTSVALRGTLLAIASLGDSTVTLVDVSIPTSPVKRAELRDNFGGFNDLSAPIAVAISGNLLAVASAEDNAVTLVDVGTPSSPVLRATLKDGQFGFNELGGPCSLAFSGSLLAVGADGENAVSLIDVANPAVPVFRAALKEGAGGYEYLDWPRSLAFSGSLLAIGDGDLGGGITLVDVTDPSNPALRAQLSGNIGGGAWLIEVSGVAFRDSLLAVSQIGIKEVVLIDVSSPSAPVIKSSLQEGLAGFNVLERPEALAFGGSSGETLAIAAENGITLVDVTTTEKLGLTTPHWVGLGTATPMAPLHVIGDVIVESTASVELSAARLELGQDVDASGFGSLATGFSTAAKGDYSVAMGNSTLAAGDYSFAVGRRAQATNDGTFVWADSQLAYFSSTSNNQFLIRAAGGVGINTNKPATALHVLGTVTATNFSGPATGLTSLNASQLTSGVVSDARLSSNVALENQANTFTASQSISSGGSTPQLTLNETAANNFSVLRYSVTGTGLWDIAAGGSDSVLNFFYVPAANNRMTLDTNGNLFIDGALNPPSDRNVKQDFHPVDALAVLEKVADLPIQTWAYRNSPENRHIGPVAQDFHAAFGLNGADAKHIATVDADGVALAAIQGLNQKLEASRRENSELKERVEKLEQLLQELANR